MTTEVIAALAAAAASLIVFLFTRRAQLRGLNTTSDATIVTSAATLVKSLQKQIEILTAKLEQIERERTTDRINFTAQLNLAHSENARISLQVAKLQTELDIERHHIEQLRRRLPEITQEHQ